MNENVIKNVFAGLLDTIQLVQSLRNCLPASHIPVNSWKSEDRQFREVGGNFEGC